jgi:toxin ParE1/3/4
MKGYALSRAAAADIDGIWDYTFETWGQKQADRYIHAIRDACEALAEGASHGRPVDDIWPGVLKIPVSAHFLFYLLLEDGRVEIIRVLHRRMNVEAHLRNSPLQ